ncbi:hypothetical protein JCM24511_03296 [Saitozyma sp. JCM 24511]|nr:hypothetical protein JCM24511_03296 [Saitozyma sp. JCM 24511]
MTALSQLAAQLASEDFTSIPIISYSGSSLSDLSDARSQDLEKRKALAATIRDACLNAGFFYAVKNHSVPEKVVSDVFEQSHDFFALPSETKRTVDISKSGGNFRGYMALLSENNDPTKQGELHEAFNLGLDPSLDAASHDEQMKSQGELVHSDNLWPAEGDWKQAAAFRQATLDYYASVLALGQSLFPLFALALDLPEDFFADKIQHPAAIMRLLFYPAQKEKPITEENPGIGAHTDFECFTILRQDDVPALQVQNRAGEWIDAICIPNTFIINIGDQFARWTNDIFVSTRHRARPATTKDRYSIPFFFGCDHDVPLIPPPTCVSEERPVRYEVMTAGAYVHMRLSETYTVGKAEA